MKKKVLTKRRINSKRTRSFAFIVSFLYIFKAGDIKGYVKKVHNCVRPKHEEPFAVLKHAYTISTPHSLHSITDHLEKCGVFFLITRREMYFPKFI
jgi:hypothetical protein